MKRQNWYLSTIDPQAEKLAREYGLGLEIAEFCTAVNLDTNLEETDRTVGEKMKYTDRFILHGPFNELFPCAIDPMARELARYRYRQAIALARRYGAEKVVIHGGYIPRVYFPEWFEEQSILFWKEFLPEIPKGMTVCLENVLEPSPQMLLAVVQAVNDERLRLCLDVGHANAYSKRSVYSWLEESTAFLSHLHIHNNDGTGDTHSPLYEGSISIKELLDRAWTLCPEVTGTLELPDSEPTICWLLEEETWNRN